MNPFFTPTLLVPRWTSIVPVCWIAFHLIGCAGLKTTDDEATGLSAVSGWLHWRGPHQNGASDERGLPNHIHLDDAHQLWTYPLAGQTTPVVAGDRVYAFGYRGDGTDFEEVLVSLDAASGALQWEHAWQGISPDASKPRAVMANPTVDKQTGIVAAITSTGVLTVFSPAGTLLWQHAMNEQLLALTDTGAPAAAPSFDGDLLILQVFTADGQPPAGTLGARFNAFHKRTGKLIWRGAPLAEHQYTSLSSPVFERPMGRAGFWVTTRCGHVVCVDTEDGQLLWRQQLSESALHSSLVLDENRVFVVFGQKITHEGADGAIVALKKPSQFASDKPISSRPLSAVDEVWRTPFESSGTSPVDGGDVLFQLNAGGDLLSVEKETGKIRWQSSLGKARPLASPIFADGKLYVALEDGHFFVLGPTLHGAVTLSKTKLAGQCLSSPSTFDGRIFVHTTKVLYAFGSRSNQPPRTPSLQID